MTLSRYLQISLSKTPQIFFERKYMYRRNQNQFGVNLYSRNYFTNSQHNVHLVLQRGTLSVILSDCSMNKMERDIALPLKSKFYRRFVDDTCRKRNKNKTAELFSKMNSYHPNIDLTIDINPSKFLDTKIVGYKNENKCFFHHKETSCLSIENLLCQEIK